MTGSLPCRPPALPAPTVTSFPVRVGRTHELGVSERHISASNLPSCSNDLRKRECGAGPVAASLRLIDVRQMCSVTKSGSVQRAAVEGAQVGRRLQRHEGRRELHRGRPEPRERVQARERAVGPEGCGLPV